MKKKKLRRRVVRPGRQNDWNRRTRYIIKKALKARLPRKRASELANVSISTFNNWMKLGEVRSNQAFYRFREAVKKIEAENERIALEIIDNAQKGGGKITETKIKLGARGREITKVTKTLRPQWSAAAWWLERTKPEDYNPLVMAKKDSVEDAEEIAKKIWEAVRKIDETVPEQQ